MMEEMEILHTAIKRVKSLLDNPEPGLMTWNKMLADACKENQRALLSLGVTPKDDKSDLAEVNSLIAGDLKELPRVRNYIDSKGMA